MTDDCIAGCWPTTANQCTASCWLTTKRSKVWLAEVDFSAGFEHKVHIYLEYHSVCPLVRFGTPPPSLSRKRVCSAPRTKGGTHSLTGEGVGGPNSDDWRKSQAFCLLCGFEGRLDVKCWFRIVYRASCWTVGCWTACYWTVCVWTACCRTSDSWTGGRLLTERCKDSCFLTESSAGWHAVGMQADRQL